MSDNDSVSDESSSGPSASPRSRAELATVPTFLTDHSGSHSYESCQNASFSPQSHCRSLLSKVLADKHQRALVCDLSGGDAQLMANYLDLVTRDANAFDASGRRRAMALLCSLAESSQVFPGCYELKGVEHSDEIIGSGGFADVYKGKYRSRAVCLKAFRVYQEQSRNEKIVKARAYEITLWAHLQHKNLLPFYGVYYSGGSLTKLCLISPWMEGGNIRNYLENFPEAPRVVFISDILDGLSYLHDLSIVHADLKAENILISNNGFALITDFGVSSIAATSQLSSVTSRGGTVHCLAPELVLADNVARATTFCDIWSFACLCFEILANKRPFYRYQLGIQILAAMMRQEFPYGPESAGREEIGDQLWDLLTRCWNYIPKDRPTCKMLRDSITKIGIRDDQSRTAEVGDNDTFGGTMGEGYNDRLDYVRLQGILFHINASTVNSSIIPISFVLDDLTTWNPLLSPLAQLQGLPIGQPQVVPNYTNQPLSWGGSFSVSQTASPMPNFGNTSPLHNRHPPPPVLSPSSLASEGSFRKGGDLSPAAQQARNFPELDNSPTGSGHEVLQAARSGKYPQRVVKTPAPTGLSIDGNGFQLAIKTSGASQQSSVLLGSTDGPQSSATDLDPLDDNLVGLESLGGQTPRVECPNDLDDGDYRIHIQHDPDFSNNRAFPISFVLDDLTTWNPLLSPLARLQGLPIGQPQVVPDYTNQVIIQPASWGSFNVSQMASPMPNFGNTSPLPNRRPPPSVSSPSSLASEGSFRKGGDLSPAAQQARNFPELDNSPTGSGHEILQAARSGKYPQHVVNPKGVSERTLAAAKANRKREAKFQCHICNSSHTSKQRLENHITLKHLQLKHFPCPFPDCTVKYSQARSVNRHLDSKHPGFRQASGLNCTSAARGT